MDEASSPSNESQESNDTAPVSTKQEAMVKGNLHIAPTKISASTSNQDDEENGNNQNDDNFTNDNEEWMCAICWTEYLDGEDICWSPNSACAHNFHRDCIQEWLTSHDECPCCRSDYLGGGGGGGGGMSNFNTTTTTTTTTTRTARPPPVTMASNNTNGGGDPGMMMMPTTNQGSMISLIDFVRVVYAMQQLYHMSPPVATRFPSTMMLRNHSNDEGAEEGDIEVGPAVEDYGLPTELQMTRIELEPRDDMDEPQDDGGAYSGGLQDLTHDVPAIIAEESIQEEESTV
jgi:hypothetical protein